MHVKTLLPFLSVLSVTLAFPARKNRFQPRDEASALAILSGYNVANCSGFPIGGYVLEFDSQGICEGNGTVAQAVNVEKLEPGCVGKFI